MSYVKLHSPKLAEKRRRKIVTLLFLLTLCATTLLATFVLLLRLPVLQVRSVTVEGAILSPKTEIESAAISSLSGKYFKVIPHSSIVFFSKSELARMIKDRFKEVDDFSVRRTSLDSLALSIREREPAAVVCSGFREVPFTGECYWTDSRGLVFLEVASTTASTAQAEAYNHYYLPTEKGGIDVGERFIDENRFAELEKFIKGASRGGLLPLGVLVSDNGEYEMYVKNRKGDSEVTIYFDDRFPFSSTLANLLAFWQNPSGGERATTTQAFDYINLRFGNTVYYSTQ